MGIGSASSVTCGVGHRRGSDPELLWPWHRLEATAPTGPLGLGTSICHGRGSKKRERQKERKERNALII